MNTQDIKDINTLFENIRSGEVEKCIDYINSKNEDEIDINIKDNRGIYLINYAIVLGNSDLLNAIIKKNPILDIIDTEGKSILYHPIKFNWIKILDIILKYNRYNIGISIIDIKDSNGNIPLHYAIINKNLQFAEILIKEGSNINLTDNKGNNSLHLSVLSESYDLCKLILNNDISANKKNYAGESAIHLACNLELFEITSLLLSYDINYDIQDNETEFSPLHYSVNLGNSNISNLLINKGCNPNLQDFLGNTPLHYSIIEENESIFFNLMNNEKTKSIININIFNYENKLPLHIALEKKIINFINSLIDDSNLNFQDINGNTPLHYLFKDELWKNYTNKLEKKKLNVFTLNKNKLRPIDYINLNDLNDILDIITNSYIYIIRTFRNTWNEEWENKCNKELFYNELTSDDFNQIKKYIEVNELKSKDKGKDICKDIIKSKILYLKNNNISNTCGINSHPIKKNRKCVNIMINDNQSIDFCNFTGITLDILVGLIYLLKKHKMAGSTITKNFIENQDLCDHYKNIGIITKVKCEFLNFEVVWIEQKIYFSTDFETNFINILQNKNKRFIIIPLGIEFKKGGHANYLIYDKNTNELERFEPYGSSAPFNFDYNPEMLDTVLISKFSKFIKDIKYIKPKNFLPKIGFQFLDSFEKKTQKIGDPGGFCALWSIWYVDQRLTFYEINRTKLVNKMLKELKLNNLSFKDYIRNYSKDILFIRNDIFQKTGLTINNWINDQYTDDQINQIINIISNMIDEVM